MNRLALCCVLALYAGCGLASRDVVTIRYWNGFTGPDGRTMLRMVKQFNAENPDVRVTMQRMDWSTYYNKLFVAGLGGRAPELFVIHAHTLERFLQARFLDTVDDLVRGPNGIDESDLAENVWAEVEHGGLHYGLPLDVHPLGMYYNKKLFREAGLVDATGEAAPPRTRDEFLDALGKLTRDTNGDGVTDQWGYVFTWFRTNVVSYMAQWGGELFTPDFSRCVMNGPENVEALQFSVDLIQKYHYAPPPESYDSWIGVRQGKVGIVFEGVYMLADLQKQTDLDYGAAPVPVLGKRPAAWASSHTLCLRAGLNDAQRQAAWRFMRFLSDHSLDWAEGGQVPVRRSLRETERFARMPVQSAFAKELPYLSFLPNVPFIFEYLTEYDVAVEKALRGSVTPQQALDDATVRVDTVIARHRAMMDDAESVHE
ncbi:MAG: multiple sugar transport system substrate-binding protein [Candidatus Hydrogenedentes bacterium]|nr:multiple sugar transport system substrate-binding protein [Candidatus Hydrogenedentota bacterium]